MAIYKKVINLGTFAQKGIDIKDGDSVTILDEGKPAEGKFGIQNVFKIKITNGEERNFSFNSTSLNNMIDAFGEDSKNWVGEKVKVWAIRSNVQGKMINVYYLSHPEAELNEEGVFTLPGKSESKLEEIPVIEDEENQEDE